MGKTKNILFDKAEVILNYLESGSYQTANLRHDQISKIQFEKVNEKKLFKTVESEEIQIFTNRRATPILIKKSKEAKYFDEYKEGFRIFAKNNRISLIDNTKVLEPVTV